MVQSRPTVIGRLGLQPVSFHVEKLFPAQVCVQRQTIPAAAIFLQRRRRGIFVETHPKKFQAPAGATYSDMPPRWGLGFYCFWFYKYTAPDGAKTIHTGFSANMPRLRR